MLDSTDHVVVGLSGGADSVCLLVLLNRLKEESGYELSAVHIHHGLRKEADMEADYVKKLCHKLQVPCRVEKIDVSAYQKEHHTGIEESARILRYEVFEREIKNGAKIALAHHKNDQAETVLFHLFRGSNLNGLCGMSPVRGNYIRPLLCVTRDEIEAYLQADHIAYVTDESNYDTAFKRNCIRHNILTTAEDEICKGAVSHICTTAESVSQALDYLQDQVDAVYQKLVTEAADGCRIRLDDFCMQHPYIQTELVYRMIFFCSGRKKDISKKHVDNILGLVRGQSGKRIRLIYKTEAYTDQYCLHVHRILDPDLENVQKKKLPSVKMRVFDYKKDGNVPVKNYTKWFDYDKIKKVPVLRYRKSGDYFYCTQTARKKLQDYMVDVKIPLTQRDEIPLVADEDHIMWIVGYRISEYYKVTDTTRQILEITIEEEKNDE